jgi:antibiotic biosynthesis monooxygenase (ABM) superfamily enzyme
VPPRWTFAVVVWLAIYPSLTLLVWLAGSEIAHWPLALRTLVFTVVLVRSMVFLALAVLQPNARRGSSYARSSVGCSGGALSS